MTRPAAGPSRGAAFSIARASSAAASLAAGALAEGFGRKASAQGTPAPLPPPAAPANGGKRPQRVALIGADHYHATSTPNYLQILQRESLDIVGIHAPEPGYADKWAEQYKTVAYTDYRKMFETTKPDFVVALGHHAAMPAEFRYLVSVGVPFVMEKPWGADDWTINELADLAESKKAWVALPMPFRYGQFAQTATRLREAGQLGTISHALFRFNQPGIQRYYNLGSGWMLDREGGGRRSADRPGHPTDSICCDSSAVKNRRSWPPRSATAMSSQRRRGLCLRHHVHAERRHPLQRGGLHISDAECRRPIWIPIKAQLLSAEKAFLRGGGGTGTESIDVITDTGLTQEKPPEGYLGGWPRVVHECLDRLATNQPPPATPRDMARAATLAWDAYRIAHEPVAKS